MKTKLLLFFAVVAMVLNSTAQTRMGLIGAGANGWCDTCDIELLSTDNTNYTKTNVTLTNGEVKFREIIGTNGVWNANEISASSATSNFPNGTGVAGGGPAINAVTGVYTVSLNRITKVYTFTATVIYNTLNVSGTAVGATPLALFTANGINYFRNGQNFTAGNLLINQTAPSATTWSSTAFPSGTATAGTAGIPVTAGRYNFTFNRTTGAFAFSPVIISVTGPGVGGFGTDTNMTTTNGINYTLSSLTITGTGATALVKFRQNNDWAVQWGSLVWPTGTGAESGDAPNIPAVAGNYSVTLNRVTGAYAFTLLSTDTFKKAGFDVFPNPSNNVFNFTSKDNPISSIQIVDMLGKVVLSRTANQNEVNVDASGLTSGVYFANVTAAGATETVKLLKN